MRTVSGMILAAMLAFLVGCGQAETPQATAPLTDPNKGGPTPPTPPPQGDPEKTDPKPPMPPAPTAGWEMDPAKHAIPTSPPAGKLAGAAFAPETMFQGDTLTFRMMKEGIPERQVTLKLSPEKAKTAGDGLKLTVKEDQAPGPDVPTVMTEVPSTTPGGETKAAAFVNGYALTLELGRRDKGTLPGKVYLSLPGDAKDYLAGTFTAEWIRPVTELPGADDVPFVQGKVTVNGAAAGLQVKVGYAAEPKANELAFDVVQMPLVGAGQSARSDHAKPRATTFVAAPAVGQAARYEHTRLAPGRYLVFAAVEGGPAVWKWVSVAADAKLTLDFDIDPAKVGALDVSVPAGTTDKVQVSPADESTVPASVASGAAFGLGLDIAAKDGVAKFAKLGPGKYEVRAGELAGAVEVKPGETAKLELKKK